MKHFLDFEKPLAELEDEIMRLRATDDPNNAKENKNRIKELEDRSKVELQSLYANLSPWDKCQVARHPDRPHCSDFIRELFTDCIELAGDRGYGEDDAIVGCLARFEDLPVVVLGHEKGRNTNDRIRHNFGMAHPEGYRKAIRLMDLADRFSLPVITLIDTPGAYPGKEAEERGQSEAIARTIDKCLSISVPLISIITGEGGSGGAVALATADRVAMLEHAIYSVISPEGCASILWKDADRMQVAAGALKLTAQDLKRLHVIDQVIPEPLGGAQRDHKGTFNATRSALQSMLSQSQEIVKEQGSAFRRERYIAEWSGGEAA